MRKTHLWSHPREPRGAKRPGNHEVREGGAFLFRSCHFQPVVLTLTWCLLSDEALNPRWDSWQAFQLPAARNQLYGARLCCFIYACQVAD